MKHGTNSAFDSAGFTLIEMMVSITIFAIIIITAFDAMGNISITKVRVSDRTDLNTELYSALEKFTGIVKTWGDIDYEEYWNRQVIGTDTSSGHYARFSGFGNYGSGGSMANYGDGLYYCVSGSGAKMSTGGCLTGFNTYGSNTSLLGIPQRYGQYRQQFIDYNSNANYDSGWLLWDENGDGNIRGDDDDEDTGTGPGAFTGGVGMKELYLIKKWAVPERTYLRWTIKPDPNGPIGAVCELSGAHMGSGNCLGNIQMLKLVGKDLGLSHSWAIASPGRYDGVTDTWECRDDFDCTTSNIPTSSDQGWIDIFPDWINVRDVDFYPYPAKDFRYGWKESDDSFVLNPYVRIRMTLGLAWEKRRKVHGPSEDITITTTVNLSR